MIIIDNKKIIQFRIILIVTLLLIIIIAISCFKENFLILIALIWIFGGLVLLLFRQKYFHYENSGEVISIKYHHPFQKTNRPHAEFPLSKVHNVILKKEKFFRIIVFELKKESNGKIVRIKYLPQGLTEKEFQSIANQ